MTLQELYANIGGDYEQALKTLRVEKLIDKHIRKLPASNIFAGLTGADPAKDGTKIFESSHAMKGVCANLGLVKMASLASDICEEFRPGSARKCSDAEISAMIKDLGGMFDNACLFIKEYEKNL